MKKKKRIFPRIDVNVTIRQLGNAVNISEGGICIFTDNPLPVGSKVDLDLFLSDTSGGDKMKSTDTVKTEGTVVWVKYSELFNKYEVGVMYSATKASDREKIRSYIEDHSIYPDREGP